MKRVLFFLTVLAILLSVFSCKKDIPVSTSLVGTWELSEDINGMTGQATHHKSGNDTIAKFSATGYEFYQKGKLVKSGTYSIKQDTFSLSNQVKNRIIWDNEENSLRDFFDIENNQLTLFIDAYDAPSVIYRRIK